MDNRTLTAIGMLLTVVALGMLKGQLDGTAVEKIITFLSGGVVGVTMPRRGDPPRPSGPAIAAIAIFMMLYFQGCATTEPYTGPVGPPELTGTEWYGPTALTADCDGRPSSTSPIARRGPSTGFWTATPQDTEAGPGIGLGRA